MFISDPTDKFLVISSIMPPPDPLPRPSREARIKLICEIHISASTQNNEFAFSPLEVCIF